MVAGEELSAVVNKAIWINAETDIDPSVYEIAQLCPTRTIWWQLVAILAELTNLTRYVVQAFYHCI